jgi:ubiquitin-protein ligase
VWTPALNVAALLKTIQLLMNAPNPDDGLVIDIVQQRRDKFAVLVSLLSDN